MEEKEAKEYTPKKKEKVPLLSPSMPLPTSSISHPQSLRKRNWISSFLSF